MIPEFPLREISTEGAPNFQGFAPAQRSCHNAIAFSRNHVRPVIPATKASILRCRGGEASSPSYLDVSYFHRETWSKFLNDNSDSVGPWFHPFSKVLLENSIRRTVLALIVCSRVYRG